MKKKLGSILRRARPYLGVVICLALVLFLRKELARIHPAQAWVEIRALPLRQIFAALAFTLLSYLSQSGYDLLGFAALGLRPRSIPRVVETSLICQSLTNNAGHALILGGPIRLHMYSELGLGLAEITTIVFVTVLTYWLGYIPLLAISSTFFPHGLIEAGLFPVWTRFLTGGALLAVVAMAVFGMMRQEVRLFGWRWRPQTPWLVPMQALVGACDLSFAAAAAYFLLPAAGRPSYAEFLPLFVATVGLGILSQSPGGLGVVETTMVFLLKPYYSAEQALAAMIIFRFVFYLTPLCLSALAFPVLGLSRRVFKESPIQPHRKPSENGPPEPPAGNPG